MNANGSTETPPPVSAASGVVSFTPPRADADHRRVLQSRPWERRSSFRAKMELIVAGLDSLPPYRFPAIPASHPFHKNIEVQRPALGPRELLIGLALLALLAWTAYAVLRPCPFEIRLSPDPLEWAFPSRQAESERPLTVAGYVERFHRRWFTGTTRCSVEWDFYPPQSLPVRRGRQPIDLRLNGQPLARGTTHQIGNRWRPGRRESPTPLLDLRVLLDGDAFDVSAMQVLRRSCATWLQQSGVDVKDAQGIMRHSRASTTQDVYQQLVPESQVSAVRKLTKYVEAGRIAQ